MNRKEFLAIAKASFSKWQTNNATIRAAALAFFTILPLPSLLVILATIFGVVYGQPQALQRLIEQITVVAGPAVAEIVKDIVESAQNPFASIFGSVISVAFAVLGAIGAFAVLQDTFNAIWNVPAKKRSLKAYIRERIGPFLIVSGVSVMVFAWTSSTTLLSNTLSFVLEPIIGNASATIFGITEVFLSFILVTALFAFIYIQIPDTHIEWQDVWLAAVITGLVSTVLNYLFGWYIHTFPVTSIGGAAGSLIVLLLWIFIIDQFILFGAQFCNVYAETLGSRSKKNGR
ncbi:MAG: YihY/virulence factor BrkB family protein [Candidatus Bathyarchaeota archaeon]|nr:YihY/virulence factor BrkB family protein [Candidatus Bathyarchaeota archaeon]